MYKDNGNGVYTFNGDLKHRLTRAHREKQLKMSCQALHNAPPNRTQAVFLYADGVFSVCRYGPAVRRGLNSCQGGYLCHGRRKQASPYHGGTGPT